VPVFIPQTGIVQGLNFLFQQSFNTNGIAGQAPYSRVPFTFTSTRRLAFINGGNITDNTDSIAQNNATQAQTLQQSAVSGNTTASTLNFAQAISPTDLNWGAGLTKDTAVISMAVNPQSISWTQPKRIARKDTMQGTTFFHFLNKSNQDIDILTMDFRGTTGNIDLNDPNNIQKLQTWHSLYNLTREPQLIGDSIINDIYIGYYTKLFPMKITLIGFFSKVMDFTENAEKPNSRDYSMAFTVKRTSPSLDTILSQVNISLVPSPTSDF
jgi:hypothetical protein